MHTQSATLLKHGDHDRYISCIFAHHPAREGLFALYAFNLETARIADRVSEPMLGFIRLTWWRDALDEIYSGKKPREHEIVQDIATYLGKDRFLKQLFFTLIDGREEELNSALFADLTALELYLGKIVGTLTSASLKILDSRHSAVQDAALHIAVAFALIGTLRAAPFYIHRTNAKRVYIPRNLLTGITPELLMSKKPKEARIVEAEKAAVKAVVNRAIEHLEQAKKSLGKAPAVEVKKALPVLLPYVITRAYIRALEKIDYQIFAKPVAISRLRLLLTLYWAARRGHIV